MGSEFRYDELLERALPVGDPAVLLRIAELAAEPEADVRAIAREAGRDEALSALLLRLANSAAQGRGFRVAELPSAIVRLGLQLVGTLALTAPARRLLEAAPRDELAPARRALHEHAVRTGITARLMSPPSIDAETALAAGLLHNLGLTVLSLHGVEQFRALVDLGRRGERLALHEPELLGGVTHAELGARLAERWSYPPLLVEAIRGHDLPEPESALAQTIRAADLLTRWAGAGVESPEPMSTELLAAAAGETSSEIDDLLVGVRLQSRELAACLLDAV